MYCSMAGRVICRLSKTSSLLRRWQAVMWVRQSSVICIQLSSSKTVRFSEMGALVHRLRTPSSVIRPQFDTLCTPHTITLRPHLPAQKSIHTLDLVIEPLQIIHSPCSFKIPTAFYHSYFVPTLPTISQHFSLLPIFLFCIVWVYWLFCCSVVVSPLDGILT